MPHELPTDLRLIILGNEPVDLNSKTRGFRLVTRGFELVARKVELVTRKFDLVDLNL